MTDTEKTNLTKQNQHAIRWACSELEKFVEEEGGVEGFPGAQLVLEDCLKFFDRNPDAAGVCFSFADRSPYEVRLLRTGRMEIWKHGRPHVGFRPILEKEVSE